MIRMPGGRREQFGASGQDYRKVFLSFADSRMCRSAARLAKQAVGMEIYDEVVTADEHDLSAEFVSAMGLQLISGSRGYGYWSWKPQIVAQVLAGMSDGDVLQYTDAGCHLNGRGRDRLTMYFEMARQSGGGILAFQAKPPEAPFLHDGRALLDLQELKWTKGDLFDYFSVYDNDDIKQSQQIGGTVFFIRKCAEAEKIVSAWRTVYLEHFSLADDAPSARANFDGFIEHRHDQSIFSLLCKLNGVPTVSAYEYWYPKCGAMQPDWAALDAYPIHAKRDLDFGMLENVYRFIRKTRAQARHVMKKFGVLK